MLQLIKKNIRMILCRQLLLLSVVLLFSLFAIAQEEEKEAVETAIAGLKAAKDKTDSTGDELRAEIDKVMQAIHPISQKMYEQAQAEASAQASQEGEQASADADDVVDADYEVVDEDK